MSYAQATAQLRRVLVEPRPAIRRASLMSRVFEDAKTPQIIDEIIAVLYRERGAECHGAARRVFKDAVVVGQPANGRH